MKINTLVEFIWNSDTKEYEEVYSESYDYNGELALALDPEDDPDHYGSSTTDSGGHGSRDWNPEGFFHGTGEAMTQDEIAQGFGLDETRFYQEHLEGSWTNLKAAAIGVAKEDPIIAKKWL